MFVAAHDIRNTLDQLDSAVFFILQRIFLADAGNIDRTGGQPQQAQVIFFDRLVGICLRICRVQPLQFLNIGVNRL